MLAEISEIPAGTSRADGALRQVGASCNNQKDGNVVPASPNRMKAPGFKRCFPGGTDSKESACSAGDPGSIPESGRSLEKEMATHSSILVWEIHGQRSLVGYSP